MIRSASFTLAPLLVSFVAACASAPEGSSHTSSTTGAGAGGAGGATSTSTGGAAGAGGSSDAGTGEAGPSSDCSVDGNPGQCITVSACAAMPGYASTAGHCPGPADIECCTMGPNVADNPPTPAGWELMQQSEVTPAMTTWAVSILDDPKGYPMFSTAMMTFGTLMVLARVEWHPPDFQNNTVHRGVTLYQPI